MGWGVILVKLANIASVNEMYHCDWLMEEYHYTECSEVKISILLIKNKLE
jgi:hypothetical protein